MTRRAPRARRLIRTAAAFFAAAALSASTAAQAARADQQPPGTASGALRVPYLPQSEDLCGGAAAAMVMRYWGARDIYADAFAPLVDHSAGGIRTGALVSALDARGWTAQAESGNPARLEQQLALRRPIIALIEVAQGRYHYVVVVKRSDRETTFHDPARAPDRSLPNSDFDRRWTATDRWMLTLLPPSHLDAAPHEAELTAPDPPASCSALVTRGIAAAETDRSASRSLLRQAANACPRSSAPWRELAGVDAIEKNWSAAAATASKAVDLDPGDQYAWQLLGTARFLLGKEAGALDAWNHAGEPRVDLVNVSGLARTRYGIVFDAAGFAPHELLTSSQLRLAQRRVSAVPSVATARVGFHPVDTSVAQVDVAVVERDAYPRGLPALAALGVGAAVNRQLDASVASLTGGGERIDAAWRWWANRPAASLAFIAPAPFIHGTWQVDVARETETFAAASRQTRSHAGISGETWLTDRWRVGATAGVDRWVDRGRQGVLGAEAEFWPMVDRFQLRARVSHWTGRDEFSSARVDATFRSSPNRSRKLLLLRTGASTATDAAPALAWPGADTGHVRDVLLRAHPLLDDGVISDGVLGRRLIFGGAEFQRWSSPSKWLVQYAPAAFVDVARASRGFASGVSSTQVDAGIGLRLAAPGSGVLRLDLAHGLRDGRTALSVVWER